MQDPVPTYWHSYTKTLSKLFLKTKQNVGKKRCHIFWTLFKRSLKQVCIWYYLRFFSFLCWLCDVVRDQSRTIKQAHEILVEEIEMLKKKVQKADMDNWNKSVEKFVQIRGTYTCLHHDHKEMTVGSTSLFQSRKNVFRYYCNWFLTLGKRLETFFCGRVARHCVFSQKELENGLWKMRLMDVWMHPQHYSALALQCVRNFQLLKPPMLFAFSGIGKNGFGWVGRRMKNPIYLFYQN